MHRGTFLSGIFQAPRPIVGMVHLLPLPGAPGWSGTMDAVISRAVADADALARAGFDGLVLENFGDAPFLPGPVAPQTVAAMAVALTEVGRTCDLPVGVNVLRNDAAAALALCAAAGARFMRVNVHVGAMITDQGWIEGRAHETLRARAALAPGCAILADVFVKHAVPPAGLEIDAAARDTWERGLADALIVTGPATGVATPASRLRAVREAVPDARIWIGSGLDSDNAVALFPLADGAIIGSALQRDGRAGAGIDFARARRLLDVLRTAH